MAAPGGNTPQTFFPPNGAYWNHQTPWGSIQQQQPQSATAAGTFPPINSPLTPISSPLPIVPPPPQQQHQSQAMQVAMAQVLQNNPQLAAAVLSQLANSGSASAQIQQSTNNMAYPAQRQQQQNSSSSSLISPSSTNVGGGSNSPAFPSNCTTPSPPAGAMPNEVRSGVGVLIWLSSKAGLIRCCGSSDLGAVSFQLKDFCDQAINDLTAVLRPGFTLKFQALSSGQRDWIATFVAPVHGPDANLQFLHNEEVDLEALLATETGPPQMPKDPYMMDLELRAIPMLLQIFERQGLPQCQLSSFHCQISNCGDDDLYRYVGTSSLKRRQFLERRTHLFHISGTDLVSLQPAEIFTTVMVLTIRLLCRGGACLMQELFDHFNSCPEIPLEARELIGDGKTNFMRFLMSHTWIFAVFPSRVFVSIRRNLPKCSYASFLNENFADCDLRQYSPLNATRQSNVSRFSKPQLPPPTPSGPPPPNRSLSGPAFMDQSGWPPLPKHDKNEHPQSANQVENVGGASKFGPFEFTSNAVPMNGFGMSQSRNRQQPMTSGWGPPTPIDELHQPINRPPSTTIGQVKTDFWGRPNHAASATVTSDSDSIGRAGGRIKRFVDVEVQTNSVNKTVDRGCGPDDETIAVVTIPNKTYKSASPIDKQSPEPICPPASRKSDEEGNVTFQDEIAANSYDPMQSFPLDLNFGSLNLGK